MHVRQLAPLVALALPLLAAGCGMSIGDKTLDTGKLEQTIREGAGDGTIEVTSVDCPDDVEVASGTTFECRLLASDGTSAKVVVRQTDDDGNVTWRIVPDRKLLDTEKLEATIRAGIEEQAGATVERRRLPGLDRAREGRDVPVHGERRRRGDEGGRGRPER